MLGATGLDQRDEAAEQVRSASGGLPARALLQDDAGDAAGDDARKSLHDVFLEDILLTAFADMEDDAQQLQVAVHPLAADRQVERRKGGRTDDPGRSRRHREQAACIRIGHDQEAGPGLIGQRIEDHAGWHEEEGAPLDPVILQVDPAVNPSCIHEQDHMEGDLVREGHRRGRQGARRKAAADPALDTGRDAAVQVVGDNHLVL